MMFGHHVQGQLLTMIQVLFTLGLVVVMVVVVVRFDSNSMVKNTIHDNDTHKPPLTPSTSLVRCVVNHPKGDCLCSYGNIRELQNHGMGTKLRGQSPQHCINPKPTRIIIVTSMLSQ